jgi:hypothetical protein
MEQSGRIESRKGELARLFPFFMFNVALLSVVPGERDALVQTILL